MSQSICTNIISQRQRYVRAYLLLICVAKLSEQKREFEQLGLRFMGEEERRVADTLRRRGNQKNMKTGAKTVISLVGCFIKGKIVHPCLHY